MTYIPPEGSKRKKPSDIYSYVPRDLREKTAQCLPFFGIVIFVIFDTAPSSSTRTPPSKEYDAFGWEWAGNNWDNNLTDVYRTKHPHEKDPDRNQL